ncbi:MAG: hypothetical protein AAFN81_21210 [Bacteroidota bacterium]
MKDVLQRLTYQYQLDLVDQERLAPFASAMLMGPAEIARSIADAIPMAVHTEEGWTAALWLKETNETTVGQKLVIARGCRTRKIALITANYFRLHHLINQVDNSTNTSPSY